LVGAEEGQVGKTLRMKIEGMTCGFCVKKLEGQVSSLCKGGLTVDLAKGEGVCRYEAPVTIDQILAEANKTGFPTTEVK
jgi:copper chaperone CopZ